MTQTRLHSLLLLFTVALLAGICLGQAPASGPQPFGSFGGGTFDSVNLGNLNVSFTVPTVHKAGRGLPFNYDLTYANSVWYPVVVSGTKSWTPVANWGWQSSWAASTGYLTNSLFTSYCYDNMGHQTGVHYTYSGWNYHDPFGRTVGFSGTIEIYGGSCSGTNVTSFTSVATDGSGYTLNASGSSGSILDAKGVITNPPMGVPAGATSSTRTDSNGNQISANSTGVFTDTLGTTALTITGSNPVSFVYTSPSSASPAYVMHYTTSTVKTAFACSGISEYGPTSVSLVTDITLPDSSKYIFTYEPTPGFAGDVTGRIKSVTLPSGGTITYTYTGGANGITCADGSTSGLTRQVNPGGTWTYARTNVPGTDHWTTTLTDPTTPTGNQTVIDFQKASASTNFYETRRLAYQGATTGTLLQTAITCYNGVSVSAPANCPTTAVALPITRQTVFTYLPDSSGLQAETDTTFDSFALVHLVDEYDYAAGAVGSKLRTTLTSYVALGNGIVDRPYQVQIKDGSGIVKAKTTYSYDEPNTLTATSGVPQHVSVTGSRGNLTTVAAQASGTTTLYRKFTYYDTGTLKTSTELSTSNATNGALTTYNYTAGTPSCNYAFPTSISEPLNLSQSMTWDCSGGVLLSLVDENGNTSSTAYSGANYTNDFWRPYSTTDRAGFTTNYFYYPYSGNQPLQTESKSATFNNGNAIVDVLTTADGFGRTIFSQTKQGPTASSYDTVATCYDNRGRVNFASSPYSNAVITSATLACPSGNAGTSTAYDAIGRPTTINDSGGGSSSYTYFGNAVLQTLASPTQKKQLEYDALGRLKSVCEVTAGTTAFPGGTCSQSANPQIGYYTTYGYDVLGNQTGVTQNAQAPSTARQNRNLIYDMMGRLTSETNPEMNNAAVTYSYDSLSSDASCGSYTSAGNMLKRLDAAGNDRTDLLYQVEC
jgi:YD repeat-containing protein